jgi:hypothetical protein
VLVESARFASNNRGAKKRQRNIRDLTAIHLWEG